MPRSRGRYPARTGSRRRTGWEEGPGTQTPFSVSASGSQILGNGQTFLLDGITVVRLRGFIELNLAGAASAAGNGFNGAIGIGVVTDAAFAVGITAVPTPITEIAWEGWMFHQFFSLHVGDATAQDRSPNVLRFDFDSKAMRKVGADETIMAVIEMTEVGTEVLKGELGSRMLLKLP